MFWHRIESNSVSALSWYFYDLSMNMRSIALYENSTLVTTGIEYYATLLRGTDSTRCAHKNPSNISITNALSESWHLRINFARFFLCAHYWMPRFFSFFFMFHFFLSICNVHEMNCFCLNMWNIIAMVLSIFGTFYGKEQLFFIKNCATSSIKIKGTEICFNPNFICLSNAA